MLAGVRRMLRKAIGVVSDIVTVCDEEMIGGTLNVESQSRSRVKSRCRSETTPLTALALLGICLVDCHHFSMRSSSPFLLHQPILPKMSTSRAFSALTCRACKRPVAPTRRALQWQAIRSMSLEGQQKVGSMSK